MKAATISEIKNELKDQGQNELMTIALRLARFKKENKELLTYLLFESQDEASYRSAIRSMISEEMKEVNISNLYYCKKNLRRILRAVDRFIRYSGIKETEADIRIHYCKEMLNRKVPLHRTKALENIFSGQLKKVQKAIDSLHPDLQFDYKTELSEILRLKSTP